MGTVEFASLKDLGEIMVVDASVIGNDNRRDYIKEAIESNQCLVARKEDSLDVAGFLTFHRNFFQLSFISLVIVSESERRKGYASSLLRYFERIAPTKKVFSSTNESNLPMHHVFAANGYTRSGIIENLDEGDPEIIYYKRKGS